MLINGEEGKIHIQQKSAKVQKTIHALEGPLCAVVRLAAGAPLVSSLVCVQESPEGKWQATSYLCPPTNRDPPRRTPGLGSSARNPSARLCVRAIQGSRRDGDGRQPPPRRSPAAVEISRPVNERLQTIQNRRRIHNKKQSSSVVILAKTWRVFNSERLSRKTIILLVTK